MNLERISAVTIKVSDMARSVHFYNKLLGYLNKVRRLLSRMDESARRLLLHVAKMARR